MRLGEHTASCSAASHASPKKSLGLWLALSTLVGFNFGAAFKGILPNFYRWTQSDGFQIIHTNAILNDQISTPAQRSPHYYSPRPCWLPNDFTTMIFLHLVNLVTRTHETYETQLISFAAASRAVLPVYVLHRLTQGMPSGSKQFRKVALNLFHLVHHDSPKVLLFKVLQPSKALWPMAVTEALKVMLCQDLMAPNFFHGVNKADVL